jgi:hypothetical protein
MEPESNVLLTEVSNITAPTQFIQTKRSLFQFP